MLVFWYVSMLVFPTAKVRLSFATNMYPSRVNTFWELWLRALRAIFWLRWKAGFWFGVFWWTGLVPCSTASPVFVIILRCRSFQRLEQGTLVSCCAVLNAKEDGCMHTSGPHCWALFIVNFDIYKRSRIHLGPLGQQEGLRPHIWVCVMTMSVLGWGEYQTWCLSWGVLVQLPDACSDWETNHWVLGLRSVKLKPSRIMFPWCINLKCVFCWTSLGCIKLWDCVIVYASDNMLNNVKRCCMTRLISWKIEYFCYDELWREEK